MQIWIWGDDLSNKQMFHKNVPVENYKINLKNIWIQFHFYYTLPVRFCGLFSLSIFSPSINNIFLWIISLLLSIHLIVFFDNKKIFFCCFCSVTNSCPTLCVPMDRSTPGSPVLHHLPEFAQTHIHWISDAIQSTHSLLSPFPPAFNLS